MKKQSVKRPLHNNKVCRVFSGECYTRYSTISSFRNRLLELKLFDRLFDEINKQLMEKEFIVRERSGAVVDIVVMESANRPC